MRLPAVAIALVIAISLAVFAVVRGTWAVGGSDSSCYGLMADAFARGELQPTFQLALRAPWPDAARTFAPGGFIASPVRADAASPICAPGFSLLLAPFRFVGGADGIFLLTPIAAGLLVWLTFVAARNLGGDTAGIVAATVIATTPIVLFQSVQPMNDITTTTLWAGVLAAASARRPRWWLIGMLTGIATLVRPNLAPLSGVAAVWVLWMSKSARSAVIFAAAAVPGGLVLLAFNWALYGSPFRVGYGSASDLFHPSYITDNVATYARAGVATLTPFPLLALLAPLVVAPHNRPTVWLALGIATATTGVYLLYRPYPEWWYLRFLLPAILALIVLASAVATLLFRGNLLVGVLAVALAVFGVRAASERHALDLQRLESRFRHAGQVVRDRLPPNALLITVWHSGTVRYHAQREAILWDSLAPEAFDVAIDWMREQGYEPYLLLERWEEPVFRKRFSGDSAIGALDWPPRLDVDRQVRIYVPSDREKYLSGETVLTEYVFAR